MSNLSKVIEAILFTSKKPVTGYDIKKIVSTTVGSSHQQIYRTLGEMLRKGIVTKTTIPQAGKPDKNLFELVDKSDIRCEHPKNGDFSKTKAAYNYLVFDLFNGTELCQGYINKMEKAESDYIELEAKAQFDMGCE